MNKKIKNVIYGGLSVGSVGVTVASVGMAIDSFKEKDKLGGVMFTIASIANASVGATAAKKLININKKKK